MPHFSELSEERLATCDERLQLLMNTVIRHVDIKILEGRRSLERQKQLMAQGFTQTLRSKHLHDPSRAVDVCFYRPGKPGGVDWGPGGNWQELGWFVKGVAAGLGIPIRWGGDWRTIRDCPHFELMED